MADVQQTYELLCAHTRETALLGSIKSLLGWDQQTKMPAAANPARADQMGLLAGLIHQRQVDPRIGGWLDELAASPLAADPHSDSGATIRQLRRRYEKKIRQPQRLVEELTRAAAEGQQVWLAARRKDDFSMFRPILGRLFELKREQADALGYEQSRYDALLDLYEPGARSAEISQVLRDLREQLVPLVAEIAQSGRAPEMSILSRHYPAAVQESFGKAAAAQIGFDFDRGRLDETAHPFCSGISPNDTRLTTRYDEHFFNSGFFSILHEAGHGIYDQGLPPEHFGLPPGESISLGIHESQSRMWENLVGRSYAFWEHFFPQAQAAFPQALRDVALDAFFFAINEVRPSLIRVEADEATYNLHILIRFELEQSLLDDDLQVADLPEAWNARYREDLGIEPPSDADGVLQDVHWGSGAIGYFPTYTLGNLYASQFFEKATADLGGIETRFAAGDFAPLREWLAREIYQLGQRYSASELVERVTAAPLSHEPLIRHLRSKLGRLYGLD